MCWFLCCYWQSRAERSKRWNGVYFGGQAYDGYGLPPHYPGMYTVPYGAYAYYGNQQQVNWDTILADLKTPTCSIVVAVNYSRWLSKKKTPCRRCERKVLTMFEILTKLGPLFVWNWMQIIFSSVCVRLGIIVFRTVNSVQIFISWNPLLLHGDLYCSCCW